jgi:hypothetical protein
LDGKHSIGPTENIMDVVYITNKGIHMNTTDKFYKHKEIRVDNQINDKNTVTKNTLFRVSLQKDDKLGGAVDHSKNQ